MPKIKVKPDKQVLSWRWRIYKAELTIEKFCERFNLWQSAMSDWLRGKKVPNDDTRKKIEKLLKKLGV